MSNIMKYNEDVNFTKELSVRREDTRNFLATIQEDFMQNYPASVQTGVAEIFDDVNNNRTLPERYGEILEWTNVGQSLVQSHMVQLEQHHTPHRVMKQLMLELDNKESALNSSKNGHHKSMVLMKTLSDNISSLKSIIDTLSEEDSVIDENIAYLLIMEFPNIFPEILFKKACSDEGITNRNFINSVLTKLEDKIGKKIVKFEETERDLKAHQHMIKDAAVSTHWYKQQIELVNNQVKESGISFEASEMIYYVMYFTAEGEKQIRTGGRVDTGTFGVVANLPSGLQRKVHSNWEFISNKVKEEESPFHGYYWREYKDIMEPKQTGENEFENVSVEELLNCEILKNETKEE